MPADIGACVATAGALRERAVYLLKVLLQGKEYLSESCLLLLPNLVDSLCLLEHQPECPPDYPPIYISLLGQVLNQLIIE